MLSSKDRLSYSMQMIRSCDSKPHISISPLDNLVHSMDHTISWILQNVLQLQFKTEGIIIGANSQKEKPFMLVPSFLSLVLPLHTANVCTHSLPADLITVILLFLVYPRKPWNADDVKCRNRCLSLPSPRQRTHCSHSKILSLMADFKILCTNH